MSRPLELHLLMYAQWTWTWDSPRWTQESHLLTSVQFNSVHVQAHMLFTAVIRILPLILVWKGTFVLVIQTTIANAQQSRSGAAFLSLYHYWHASASFVLRPTLPQRNQNSLSLGFWETMKLENWEHWKLLQVIFWASWLCNPLLTVFCFWQTALLFPSRCANVSYLQCKFQFYDAHIFTVLL